MLLEKGADINVQCGKYGNALLAASYGGHPDVVRMLHAEGADVNAPGIEYWERIAEERHSEILETGARWLNSQWRALLENKNQGGITVWTNVSNIRIGITINFVPTWW